MSALPALRTTESPGSPVTRLAGMFSMLLQENAALGTRRPSSQCVLALSSKQQNEVLHSYVPPRASESDPGSHRSTPLRGSRSAARSARRGSLQVRFMEE